MRASRYAGVLFSVFLCVFEHVCGSFIDKCSCMLIFFVYIGHDMMLRGSIKGDEAILMTLSTEWSVNVIISMEEAVTDP